MARESAYFIINNVDGKHDVGQIKQQLDTLHGVTSVSFSPKRQIVAVDYDSSGTSYDKIEHCINRLGFEIAADASDIRTW